MSVLKDALPKSLLIIFLTGFISGCGQIGKKVSIFERQDLSRPGMELTESSKDSASIQHMINAREGSIGGFGGAGGGCGCN